MTLEFVWVDDRRVNGLPTIAECEAQGFVKVRPHPCYPTSWLMRRDLGDE